MATRPRHPAAVLPFTGGRLASHADDNGRSASSQAPTAPAIFHVFEEFYARALRRTGSTGAPLSQHGLDDRDDVAAACR